MVILIADQNKTKQKQQKTKTKSKNPLKQKTITTKTKRDIFLRGSIHQEDIIITKITLPKKRPKIH